MHQAKTVGFASGLHVLHLLSTKSRSMEFLQTLDIAKANCPPTHPPVQPSIHHPSSNSSYLTVLCFTMLQSNIPTVYFLIPKQLR